MVVFWPLLSQPSGRREAGGGEEGEGEEGMAGPGGTQRLPPAACWKKCFPTPAGESVSKPADFLPFLIELKMGLFSSDPPTPPRP